MTRGLQTLFYKRKLLNPFRYGWFAWMLWSHKLARWLVPWALILGAVTLILLPATGAWTLWMMALALAGLVAGLAGWLWRPAAETFPLLRTPAYVVAGLAASLHAWINALRGELNPTWEPTRREGVGGNN